MVRSRIVQKTWLRIFLCNAIVCVCVCVCVLCQCMPMYVHVMNDIHSPFLFRWFRPVAILLTQ